MFKFLRKYNKWILAVGGTLLMIVFLIPQAIEGFARSAGAGRATRATVLVDGRQKRISAAEWDRVQAEFDIISRRSQLGSLIPAVGRLEGANHWFLLTHEADRAGLVGPPGASQIPLEFIGGPRDIAESTLAKLEGVYRLVGLYQSSAMVSDHRLRSYAKRMLHQVNAEVIVIPASPEKVDHQPTEAELAEQLQRYGHLRPGEGEMGFGYRLPDRLKIEWIAIPAESVRQAILESDQMDNVALRTHWMRELRRPDTRLPPMTDDPEIPDVVRQHLLDQLTNQQLEEITRFANDQFRASRRGLQHVDGYVVLPEDWDQRQLPMVQVAQDIQKRFNIETPEYHAIGDRWITLDELDDLPGIGRATTDRFGTQPRDLYDLAYGAREFGRTHVGLIQQGVTGPPLRDADGGVYFFRISDIDPARQPSTVDEVRDQLVRDVKRRAHYQQLAQQISDIQERARIEGMLAVAMDHNEAVQIANITLTDAQAIQQQSQFGQAIHAVPTPIPGIGINRKVSEEVIDRALQLPVATPVQDLPIDQRVFALEAEDSLAVIVISIRRNMPLTEEVFVDGLPMIRALMLNEELGTDRLREAFSLESLTRRHGFQLHAITGAEEQEAAEQGTVALAE